MIRYSARIRSLAVGLAALAGFVDTLGFLQLDGFFVSFMSGNSTRLAVGLAQGSVHALIAGGLVATFLIGVIGGATMGRWAKSHRRPAVLTLVSGLLGIGAVMATLGSMPLAIGCMILAMGAENAVFEDNGEVRIGLTYMTGALVRIGQGISSALAGGSAQTWIPFLTLWLGLVVGGVIGALTYGYLGLGGLWIAAGAAAAMAAASARLEP